MTELYLISGVLGAGKTTLLQKLLREGFAGQKVALVENDFGAVSLDAKLLKSGGYTVKELRAGCICCTLNGNFVSALVSLLRRVQPDVVLIEPSGVAKLSDVEALCRDHRLAALAVLWLVPGNLRNPPGADRFGKKDENERDGGEQDAPVAQEIQEEDSHV